MTNKRGKSNCKGKSRSLRDDNQKSNGNSKGDGKGDSGAICYWVRRLVRADLASSILTSSMM
jgi:hypothetical protein